MNILVTSSRTPFAIDLVLKLGRSGHEVYAADSYVAAPGSHSRFARGHFTFASAQDEPERFVADVERTCREHAIELVVPAFEEAFYLAVAHERLAAVTRVFTAPFATLARLHDKSSFQRLCVENGLPVPETVVARSDEELRAALGRFPRYFARAAFSRGGISLLTNTGPLAGHLDAGDVHPSETSPWLVQPFVDGPMNCSYSTVHEGRVTAHCAYRAPRQWEHSTGIQFESVDPEPTLALVRRIVERLGYTGQVSFDFVAAGDGLKLIECNPRPTDGVLLMDDEQLARGITAPQSELSVVEPGRVVQLDWAVLAQAFDEPLHEMPGSFHDLVHLHSADRGWHDLVPQLYSFLALADHERISLKEREGLFAAMSDDICWDGAPIPGMSAQDAALLGELERERAGTTDRSG